LILADDKDGMPAAVRWIDRAVEDIGRWSAWAAFALVCVMAGNVLLRYVFNTGSVWAQELEWHLMAPICLFGMSYALAHGEHVRVDVLFAKYSAKKKLMVEIVSALLGLAVCVAVVWLSRRYVGQSFGQNEGSVNPGGIPFRWALKSLIPIGFAVLGAQYAALAARFWIRYRSL
jgi:TRAP-type mannitol/chloroaromatic compound transport system permease small subunit